ncbi:M14 family metallopeptidase [Aquisalinus luteolus]|uniref:Peptidase M14 n=2 Tax=Aquisalinus luteolus TaxID=1566827 RepID=A0A8J3A3M7_9PROT|nr:M14 family metallopeptidase [Aquisalinus luteolus]GGH96459.1 peptidase M14 [Aquisalinus luteolus]
MHLIRFFAGMACAASLSTSLATTAAAQTYPSADYSDNIPTLEAVIGHDHGEELTTPSEIVEYFEALAAADPTRMQVRSYGETWQGRDLTYAIISSPENMQRLEDIQADLSTLASGEALSDSQLDETPAVVWLSYGVHGDEITPPDSGVFMAYHLLAAEGNALVDTILDNTIVIIDPAQNPDGRNRFVQSFISTRGLEAQGDRYAAEHDQPWPRGRYNHYMFDLNRDWFAMTQPETKGKVAAVLEWHPVVYVDSHEMSGDSTYFFPPSADPFNPNITDDQRATQVRLGQNMARYFDEFGVPYFTREVYDAFYPGYGDMWPTLNGAVAMTFEQASPRGLVWQRRDGTELTYAEGVRNNVLSSLATLETVARNKEDFLRDYGAYRRSAISEASGAERYYVFDLSSGRYEAESLARRLVAQGIEVQRAPAGSRHCGAAYDAGALIVDGAQPQGRLIRTLLSPSTDLPPDFVEEQESRRERDLGHELYDVTAWSLPLMDGVEARQCATVALGSATAVSADDPIPAMTTPGGSYGQIVPWTDSGQARLVIAALRAGLQGRTTDEPFTKDGRVFPAGTVVFPAAGNPGDMAAKLRGMAERIGAELVPMNDSWVEDGPNFGSSAFATMTAPRIAMAWGEGTDATSAGNTRFVLERDLGLPVTPIRASSLARADLSEYDVLILPDNYGGLAGEIGRADAIKTFVRNGGVLVAISGSVSMLASEDYGLLSTKLEYAATEDEEKRKEDAEGSRAPGTILDSDEAYEAQIRNTQERPEDVPGVILRAVANTDHWLAAGYDGANVLVTGADIYRPLNDGDGTNVFRFAQADDMLLSGYLWEENRAQLAYKPFVMAQRQGDGLVIGFTQSPTTRAYLNGLNLLLANAVVLAPARVR